MGGDVTVASAASQQNKNSQSQSSADSSQVDGTQPALNVNMTLSTDQLLCEPDEQSLLHKNFQTVKSKQLLQEECCSSSLNNSSCDSKKNIKFASSTDLATAESLKSCKIYIACICDWLCENSPCSHANFDPFFRTLKCHNSLTVSCNVVVEVCVFVDKLSSYVHCNIRQLKIDATIRILQIFL